MSASTEHMPEQTNQEIDPSSSPPSGASAPEAPDSGTAESGDVEAQTAHVLIVDPFKTLARYVGATLKSAGHSFEHVKTSGEAIEALKQGGFDVVFCAWTLPDNTGVRLRNYVVETETIQTLPFVLMLNDISQLNFRLVEQYGIKTYLPKGASPKKILANLRAALKEVGSQQVGAETATENLDLDTESAPKQP